MTDDVYRKLQEHLDRHPMGFPATKNGEDINLLKKMFDREQAEIALSLIPKPEIPEEIAAKLGSDPKIMAGKLDQMARNGLLLRTRKGDEVRYNLEPYVVGIMEFQIGRLDKEFMDLGNKYARARGLEEAARGIKTPKTHFWRVLAIEKSIPTDIVIHPYEKISEFIDKAGKIAVTDCICRVASIMRGEGCGKTVQSCMIFSPYAEYYIENAFPGRLISKEEAFDVIAITEEEGCVHNSQNTASGPVFICNCCPCCCGLMRTVIGLNQHNRVARSDYFAKVDEDTCTACEECVDRCPFNAVSIEDDVAKINFDFCMGCGLCVSTCTTGALSLSRKPDAQIVSRPADLEVLYDQIGKEGGRTSMKVVKVI